MILIEGLRVILAFSVWARGGQAPLRAQTSLLKRTFLLTGHVDRRGRRYQLRGRRPRQVDIGPVEHDGHGFVGSDINLLFRMPRPRLDLSPARRLSAASPHAADLVRTCAGRLRGARLPWSWPVTAARQGQGKREHTSG